MLGELAPWVSIKIILIVGALGALGVFRSWLLNKVAELIVRRVTGKIEVLLEVEGSNSRKGRVEINPRDTKWFGWQLWILFNNRHGGFVRNAAKVFFGRYGLWYGLLGICRRHKERCKCPIPYVSVPDWVIAFKRSDNSKLWIRDDVISLRYQVSCESCSKQVFISRPDVISLAMALDT